MSFFQNITDKGSIVLISFMLLMTLVFQLSLLTKFLCIQKNLLSK